MKTTLTTLLLLITLTTFTQKVRSNYNETFDSRTFKYEYNEERVTFKIDLEYKEVLIIFENDQLFLDIVSFNSPTEMSCINSINDGYYIFEVIQDKKQILLYNANTKVLTTYYIGL
jgi:hypothetical protein